MTTRAQLLKRDSALAKATADEPLYLLSARRFSAPDTLRFLASQITHDATDQADIAEATAILDLAKEMEAWQAQHRDQVR